MGLDHVPTNAPSLRPGAREGRQRISSGPHLSQRAERKEKCRKHAVNHVPEGKHSVSGRFWTVGTEEPIPSASFLLVKTEAHPAKES